MDQHRAYGKCADDYGGYRAPERLFRRFTEKERQRQNERQNNDYQIGGDGFKAACDIVGRNAGIQPENQNQRVNKKHDAKQNKNSMDDFQSGVQLAFFLSVCKRQIEQIGKVHGGHGNNNAEHGGHKLTAARIKLCDPGIRPRCAV